MNATMAMQLAECAAMFLVPGTDLRRSADEELKITDTCEYSFAVKQRGTLEDGMEHSFHATVASASVVMHIIK